MFMKKWVNFLFFISVFCGYVTCFSQVDVVYNDLVWSDEFDTNGAINASKWHHQTQLPAGGNWYNGEVQHYTNEITNSFVNNGFLNIVAKKEPYTNQGVTKQYTSARLNSKFAFLYGRIDVRAKIPTNQGTWPAIWTLGKNINEDGAFFDALFGTTNWPACGEIDLMEHGITPSQPANYIQSAIHTPSSFGNTVNYGGTLASNLGTDYHVYSMNWSPNQITFLLDGVAFYTYNPAVKNASTWPFIAEQYLLLNIAMGGIAGTIPSNFSQASMEIDYVRVFQNTTPDTQAPTNFMAAVGAITNTSIELLLNANDNSGSVFYTISYGSQTINVANPSGVQKSVLVPNLTPNTSYTFSISATDSSGNAFVNNPIVLTASTIGSTGCNGTNNTATEGSFSVGYNWNFETIGSNVKITFALLDTDKVGVVAFLRRQSPFLETQMTPLSGNIFTSTITGLTMGTTINYAVKFAFAGGLAVTQYFSYVVGDNCTLSIENNPVADHLYFENPVAELLDINTDNIIKNIEIYSLTGNLVASVSNTSSLDMNEFSKGVYLAVIYIGDKRYVRKLIKK